MIRLVVDLFGLRLAVKLTRPDHGPAVVSNTATDLEDESDFGFRPAEIDAHTDTG
ncbi:hypothetical protein Lesp02_70640 [Lentzea sp. NBRC 105346]|uniref:hypothetical protein n=1 Tax=Lentzea sp. NBRC 105346 TaxID=3032205 RepID=UPI0024A0C51F|nr:hypothetical protein [Lentzea sp. NBRC 105346]GLZ34877.1 hypothetical protein Lesp02_70640 [Lentzea sp. NBRC 105346]